MTKDKPEPAAPAPENIAAKEIFQAPLGAVEILEEIEPEVGTEVEFNAQAGRSTDMRRYSTAMARAQGMVRNAKKSSENPHFSSHYAGLAEIADACRAALSANQISWEQIPKFTESEIWMETILTHGPSGQYRIGRWPIPNGVRGDMQKLMAAFTYARRGSLAMMVGVVSEDDDDDGNSLTGEPRDDMNQDQTRPAPPPTKQRREAEQWAPWAVRKIAGIKTMEELTKWEEDKAGTLTDLKRVFPEGHASVMDAIKAAAEKLKDAPANG